MAPCSGDCGWLEGASLDRADNALRLLGVHLSHLTGPAEPDVVDSRELPDSVTGLMHRGAAHVTAHQLVRLAVYVTGADTTAANQDGPQASSGLTFKGAPRETIGCDKQGHGVRKV